MEALLLVAEHDGPTMFARIRRDAGVEPSRRAGVQAVAEGQALGSAETGKGAMKAGREIIAAPCRTDWNIGGLGSLLRMARDRWVEVLRCPDCRRTGEAQLSAEDKLSWEFRVDSLPSGFKVCEPMMGGTFYCISCGTPVEL
jgi:hypothetical protein